MLFRKNKTLPPPPPPQDITVTLPNGRSETITLPSPSRSDLKWAQKLDKKPNTKLYCELCKYTQHNIWRLHHLLEYIKKEKTAAEQNKILNSPWIDADTPLSDSVVRGDYVGAVLLLASGADMNRGSSGLRLPTPICQALIRNNFRLVKLLIENGAKFYSDELQLTNHLEIKAYLANAAKSPLDIRNAECRNLNNGQQSPATALPAASAPPEEDSTKDMVQWRIAGDSIIKTVTVPERMRLNTVFNFKAEHIFRFTETLDEKNRVTATGTPSQTEGFKNIHNRREIADACAEFTRQGGDPSLTRYAQSVRSIKKRAP